MTSQNQFRVFFAAIFLLCVVNNISASGRGSDAEAALYSRIDYDHIFDQRIILVKNARTLRAEGLPRVEAAPTPPTSCLRRITGRLSRPGYEPVAAADETDDDDAIEDEELQTPAILLELARLSETLDQALVTDFLRKKKSAMMKAFYLPCGACTLETGCLSSASCCLPGSADGMGRGFSAFAAIQTCANSILQLGPLACALTCMPPSDPLEQYEIEYAKLKRFLPAGLQEKIECEFGSVRKNSMQYGATLKFLSRALKIPLKSRAPSPSPDLYAKINNLVRGYRNAPTLHTILSNAAYDHIKRYTTHAGPAETDRTQVYLHGAPGTGKSFIVEQFAKLIGLPLIKLTAKNGVATVIGTEDTPGSFLEGLCQTGIPRNAIIFIDEAATAFNDVGETGEMFKELLEPGTKFFRFPYLNAAIDISHLCIIAAGNGEIDNIALKTRFEDVEMGLMYPEFKKEILMSKYNRKIRPDILSSIINDALKNDREDGIRSLDKAVKHRITILLREAETAPEIRPSIEDLRALRVRAVSNPVRHFTTTGEGKEALP